MANFVYVLKETHSDAMMNRFAELGWEILIPQPLIIFKQKRLPVGSEFVAPIVERVETLANESYGYRKALSNEGIKFKRIHSDERGKCKYALNDKGMAEIHRWRIEINTEDVDNEQRAFVYVTFASPNINFPAFYNADIIDANFQELISEISDLVERREYGDA